MKKILTFCSVLFFSFGLTANAQEMTPQSSGFDHKIELTPVVGYLLNGNIDFYYGELTFDNNINYGISMAVNTGYGTSIEGIYTFSASQTSFRSWSIDYQSNSFETNINYIQVNGIKEFLDDQFRPFGFLGVGASGFVPQDTSYDSWWSFAMNFGIGAKVFLTDNIGIRVQGRMLLPLYYGGAGFYCGTGGCGGGITASAHMVQGDFMAGLIIGIK
jgi:opacity protein-like surface antigen